MADKAISNAGDGGVTQKFHDNGDGSFAPYGVISPLATAGAGGITTVTRLVSAAASTNATLVKSSAGRLYKVRGYNAAAALRYLKLYNKATAPVPGTDTPLVTLALPASSLFDFDLNELGLSSSLGIGFALTVNAADSDTTALTAGDVVALNVFYA